MVRKKIRKRWLGEMFDIESLIAAQDLNFQ